MSQSKRNGKWIAKFIKDGKQHWVPGGPFPTKLLAARAEEQHRQSLDRESVSDETCAQFAARWVVEFQRPGPATQMQYEAAAKKFGEHFGDQPLVSLTRTELRTYALSIPSSMFRVIHTMLQDAVGDDLIDANPARNIKVTKTSGRTKGIITAPTMEEYKACVEACSILGGYAGEMRRMIQFSAWVGLRQGEMFALKWEDIGEDTLWIRRSRKADGSIGLPKNGLEREVVFTPPARVLDHDPKHGSPFVFHSPQGRPLLKATFAYSWSQVRIQAGCKQVRWHDWRHFAATQLVEMGLDAATVAVQMGHTDGGRLVLERYGHPSAVRARQRILESFSPAVPENPGAIARTGTQKAR